MKYFLFGMLRSICLKNPEKISRFPFKRNIAGEKYNFLELTTTKLHQPERNKTKIFTDGLKYRSKHH
jgi:hypothetical protein